VAVLSTAHQARDIASGILCRSHRETGSTPTQDTPPDFIPAATSSKMAVSPKPECLPSTSVTSTVSACAGPIDDSACALRDDVHGILSNLSPGPQCLHSGTGFQRPFTASHRLESQAHARFYSRLAACFEPSLGPDAARRLLQPRQPASTTTDRSIPRTYA